MQCKLCVCVWENLALYVRECVWEHRLQESTQVLNGLNAGKNEEMQFISDDATASIVQVTIPVNCAAFSSLIDRRDVWWFKTICTFWERECVRGDSLTPFMKLYLTETFQITLEVI